jgi:hypothetical protein
MLVPAGPRSFADEKPVPAASGPRMVLPSDTLEFGKVRAGKVISHSFPFRNPGTETLVIEDIRTGCTCTVAGKYDARLDPGGKGTIELEVDTTTLKGRINRTVRVLNNTEGGVGLLHIRGEVWQPFKVTPSAAVFRQGKKRKAKEQTLRLENLTGKPVKLSTPTCDSPSFAPRLRTLREGQLYELVVATVPPFEGGSLRALVTIPTSDPETPVLRVKAMAHVSLDVSVIPPQLRFPSPVVGPTTRSATLRHVRGTPFEVGGFSVSDERVDVQLVEDKQKDRGYRVEVTLPGGFTIPPEGIEVQISTDVPSASELTLVLVPLADPAARRRRHFRGKDESAGEKAATDAPARPAEDPPQDVDSSQIPRG